MCSRPGESDNSMLQGSEIMRHFSGLPIWKSPSLKKGPATIRTLLFFLVLFFVGLISSLWSDTSKVSVKISTNTTIIFSEKDQNSPKFIETENSKDKTKPEISQKHQTLTRKNDYPLNCTTKNQTKTCPNDYPKTLNTQDEDHSQQPECPSYFRWIHEDLKPWKKTGITREMVETANKTAHFRLVIVKGKAYIEKYRKSIQTRDKFTLWGILQLLRRYPGRLPDLELMFDCDDRPVIRSKEYRNLTGPPPLFRYCGDRWTMDIVFPDWSFWGWAEINIKPWNNLLKDIKEGNKRIKWIDREPNAYWKGNPFVADTRKDLLTCNVSEIQDWNARLFIQDWIRESQHGFEQSDVASQCTHRYKIYIEGYAWSVSEKYILACDSVTLLVKPYFYDFFTRSLQPLQHYWPIKDRDKCKSIKFAVDWGNKNQQKAQEIGRSASNFIQEEVKMENVYDYMFHVLSEYSKLLKFEPRIPDGATELCSEFTACPAEGLERKFMVESLEMSPSNTGPCNIPAPYETPQLEAFYRKKLTAIRRVEKWEKQFWDT